MTYGCHLFPVLAPAVLVTGVLDGEGPSAMGVENAAGLEDVVASEGAAQIV